jgi:hypothetical protein
MVGRRISVWQGMLVAWYYKHILGDAGLGFS